MNALPQHTLPLANTSALTPWGRGSALPGTGWREALAKAEHAATPAADWSHASAHPRSPTCPVRQAGTEDLQAVAAVRVDGADRALPSVQAVSASSGDAVPAAPSGTALPLGISLRGQAPTFETGAEPQRTIARRPAPHAPVDPAQVHVHVERNAAGDLSVWFGVPRQAGAASLAALLLALRTPGPGGLAVARVTCNGHTLYAHPDPLQETP